MALEYIVKKAGRMFVNLVAGNAKNQYSVGKHLRGFLYVLGYFGNKGTQKRVQRLPSLSKQAI